MAGLFLAGDRDDSVVVWEEEGIPKLHLRDQSLVLLPAVMEMAQVAFKIAVLEAALEVASTEVVGVVSEEDLEAIEVGMVDEAELDTKVIVVALAAAVLLSVHLAVLEAVAEDLEVQVAMTIAGMATVVDVTEAATEEAIEAIEEVGEIATMTVTDMAAVVVDAMTDTSPGNDITTVTNTTTEPNEGTSRPHSRMRTRGILTSSKQMTRPGLSFQARATFTNCINCLHSYSSTVCWWV